MPNADLHDHVPTKEEISRELRKAYRGIDAMRTYAWTCAAVGALVAMIAKGALMLGGLACAIVAGLAALTVRKQPFYAASALAALVTCLLAFLIYAHVDAGKSLLSKDMLGAFVWTGGCWWAANHMRRAEVLMQRHPDLFASKLLRGEAPRRDRSKRRRQV